MFSFSAYAGSMAARGQSTLYHYRSHCKRYRYISSGLLLIYFIYPIWENLKQIKGIKMSLKGITAVAGFNYSSCSYFNAKRADLLLIML